MNQFRTTPMRALSAITLMAGMMTTGLASAQERLPARESGHDRNRAGALLIEPGALLFITFDANHDFEITPDEIELGARSAFQHADADNNNTLTPIEQRNWASEFASENDVFANPSVFPAAIPNQVTEDEFLMGLITLSEHFQDENDRIFIRDLVSDARENRDPPLDEFGDDGLERLQRPVITGEGRPNGSR